MRFTPVQIAPLGALIDMKDAIVTIKPGSGGDVVVKVGDGDITYTERRNIDYILDLGTIDAVREGDEVPVDVSMEFNWEILSSSGAGATIESAIKGTGGQGSSDPDTCQPYAVDIEIDIDPTRRNANCTGLRKIITLADFRWEQMDHRLRDASVSCTGKCNITVATEVNTATS